MPVHLFLVHFPVALLTAGAILDVAGAGTRNDSLRRVAGALLIVGSLCLIAAFMTGQGALGAALGRMNPGDPRLDTHAQWAAGGLWITAPSALIRAMWRERFSGPYAWVTLALGIGSALITIFVSLSGSAIAHG